MPVPLRSAPGRARGARRGRLRRADAGDQGDGADRARLHAAGAPGGRELCLGEGTAGRSGPPRRPRRRRGLRGRGALLLVFPPPPERRRGRGARLRPLPRARDRRLAARPPVALLPGPARALSRERHALLDRSGDPRPRGPWRRVGVGHQGRARRRCPAAALRRRLHRAHARGVLGDPVQDTLVPARLPARDDPARGSGCFVAREPRPRLPAARARGDGRGRRVGASPLAGGGGELPLRGRPAQPLRLRPDRDGRARGRRAPLAARRIAPRGPGDAAADRDAAKPVAAAVVPAKADGRRVVERRLGRGPGRAGRGGDTRPGAGARAQALRRPAAGRARALRERLRARDAAAPRGGAARVRVRDSLGSLEAPRGRGARGPAGAR